MTALSTKDSCFHTADTATDDSDFLSFLSFFDLVLLEANFAADVKAKLAAQDILKDDQLAVLDKNKSTPEEIAAEKAAKAAEAAAEEAPAEEE